MIDIKFLRENPDAVKENIKKKFQDYKLPLVDQVIELDEQSRAVKKQADELRSNRNKISKQIGSLSVTDPEEQYRLAVMIFDNSMSVRETEKMVKKYLADKDKPTKEVKKKDTQTELIYKDYEEKS